MKKRWGTIGLFICTGLSIGAIVWQMSAVKETDANLAVAEQEYNAVYENVAGLEAAVAEKEAEVAAREAEVVRAENYIYIVESDNVKLTAQADELDVLNQELKKEKYEIEYGDIEHITLEEWVDQLIAESGIELPPTHIDVDVPGAVECPNKGSDLTLADLPKNLEGNVGVLPSPVAGSALVSTVAGGYSNFSWYSIDTYSNGMRVMRTTCGPEHADPQFWLLRTDYSDGLQDADGNGLDDRDPLNNCGYSDLNRNRIIDGAPTFAGYCFEYDVIGYWLCDHGVVNGLFVCTHPDCIADNESLKGAVIR